MGQEFLKAYVVALQSRGHATSEEGVPLGKKAHPGTGLPGQHQGSVRQKHGNQFMENMVAVGSYKKAVLFMCLLKSNIIPGSYGSSEESNLEVDE